MNNDVSLGRDAFAGRNCCAGACAGILREMGLRKGAGITPVKI